MSALFGRCLRRPLLAGVLLLPGVAPPAAAQDAVAALLELPLTTDSVAGRPRGDAPEPFRSLADSLVWQRARDAAHAAPGRRLVVSLRERRLWWMDGDRVLHEAPVAVGKGTTLEDRGRSWTFATPRGIRRVVAKQANPVWIPPDWHYAELARDSGFSLVRLERGREVRLADGSRLLVRGERIVQVHPDGMEEEMPADEEVIFGLTLYVPPLGTANRRIPGELGAYKLEIGGGYMLHGTPHQDSIGRAATHGCVRLLDEDIAYLYENVPVGTPVHLY